MEEDHWLTEAFAQQPLPVETYKMIGDDDYDDEGVCGWFFEWSLQFIFLCFSQSTSLF